jgi:lipid-binding SYLF domain-containing protein
MKTQDLQVSINKSRSVCLMSIVTGLAFLGFCGTVLAADRAELDRRLHKLTLKLQVLQAKPDKHIPAENLRKAQGIILLDRTKAGFLFAYQGGGGVAMVRDQGTGQWSPPAFLSASEASLGLQIGGQQTFFVILIMNTNTLGMLTESTFKFGGEARGTAGNSSAGAEGTLSSVEPLVLVYTDSEGLYGGAAIKGGTLAPDTDANVVYYGQALTSKEILFENKVKPTPAATELAQTINEFAK